MIKVVKGDITALSVDAIVNAAIRLRRGFREVVRPSCDRRSVLINCAQREKAP